MYVASGFHRKIEWETMVVVVVAVGREENETIESEPDHQRNRCDEISSRNSDTFIAKLFFCSRSLPSSFSLSLCLFCWLYVQWSSPMSQKRLSFYHEVF